MIAGPATTEIDRRSRIHTAAPRVTAFTLTTASNGHARDARTPGDGALAPSQNHFFLAFSRFCTSSQENGALTES